MSTANLSAAEMFGTDFGVEEDRNELNAGTWALDPARWLGNRKNHSPSPRREAHCVDLAGSENSRRDLSRLGAPDRC